MPGWRPFTSTSRAADSRMWMSELSRAVSPHRDRQLRLTLINDLKLLFAALGAGGSVVPLGDNGRTARLLSNYAASLRDH